MPVHKSFKSFARAIFVRSEEVISGAEETIRKSTIAGLTAVVYATPVDEGRARSNWNVSQNEPDLSIKEPYSPGKDLGIGEQRNASKTIQIGTEKAQLYKTGQIGNFITNNLEYIVYLENGSSQQAPAGMLQFGIQAAQKIMANAKIFRKE